MVAVHLSMVARLLCMDLAHQCMVHRHHCMMEAALRTMEDRLLYMMQAAEHPVVATVPGIHQAQTPLLGMSETSSHDNMTSKITHSCLILMICENLFFSSLCLVWIVQMKFAFSWFVLTSWNCWDLCDWLKKWLCICICTCNIWFQWTFNNFFYLHINMKSSETVQ